MSLLTVSHRTIYRYREPVVLGEHRMMFRPRESHDLRLIRSKLVILPQPARLRWLHDPFDNSVAIASFEGATIELSFESTVTLEHFDSTRPDYPLEDYARTYPFRYSDEDFPNLARALTSCYDTARVSEWALRFLAPADTTGTMSILTAMTRGIREELNYTRRLERGVQSPAETLHLLRGSCRDFAVLMMEGARSLGIAARFVSGYIFTPDAAGLADGGSMHAWMQAYLPGAGWIDFDPTNRIIGNRNLIRVAVAWSPEHVLPLWGTYSGSPDSFIAMDVAVRVTEVSGPLDA
ncbi:MAG TPA: transglutaminase family protein [Gammaproteobacteria bacterium]|nr:transglutaminase family protein [Gammaproteobacteria bacterium]